MSFKSYISVDVEVPDDMTEGKLDNFWSQVMYAQRQATEAYISALETSLPTEDFHVDVESK